MTLVRDDGAFMGSGNLIDRHVQPGRYFVAVSGSGHYQLKLALRAITRATLLVNGRHVATMRPRFVARFLLRVRPLPMQRMIGSLSDTRKVLLALSAR